MAELADPITPKLPLHQLSRPYFGEPGPLSQFIHLAPPPKSDERWDQLSYLFLGKPTSKCRSCLGSLSWKPGRLSFRLQRCLAPTNMYGPWIYDTPTPPVQSLPGCFRYPGEVPDSICLCLHQLSIFQRTPPPPLTLHQME